MYEPTSTPEMIGGAIFLFTIIGTLIAKGIVTWRNR